jgi:hypothetical protein
MNEDAKQYDTVEELFAAQKAKMTPPSAVCMLGYSDEQREACACAAFARESEAEGLLREWFYANTDFDQESQPPGKDMAGPL